MYKGSKLKSMLQKKKEREVQSNGRSSVKPDVNEQESLMSGFVVQQPYFLIFLWLVFFFC